ncbi:hypothetical protein KEM09_09640 [Carboxylicivirga mesophila]|uniref:Uncharacterized protein n=1 Tax=Carboxylicivirga mesophila TaxID=1166478 RepID=A0ABS5K9I1_9BACT|nr:hypothetical protein [Carboxylicivirga mesophila]MBS2211665.1 hypothetical protein [Carboxylicivirga mesophila]
MSKLLKLAFIFLLTVTLANAQPVPGADENIPNLITFGADAETSWGDANFCQIIFFTVPKNHTAPVYIQVYDPDCGGENDEIQGEWDTETSFSIYGGKGSCSSKDAQTLNLDGNYDEGTLLASKTFGNEPEYDGKWYTFGPINPSEGEYLPEEGGHVFKVIVEGVTGDDGNMYQLFMSKSEQQRVEVEGGYAFYYKYTIRLHDNPKELSHIYPYINDSSIVSIKQTNFDWDRDGWIIVRSVATAGNMMKISGDDEWISSVYQIKPEEYNTSLDIQMKKHPSGNIRNNNVVIYFENQYGELLKSYSVPIGGVPKYKGKPTAEEL